MERAGAGRALIRAVACMDASVPFQLDRSGEALIALGASVRPLASVLPHVYLQLRLRLIPGAAAFAGVRPLARVPEGVTFQRGGGREPLGADLALEVPRLRNLL